MQRVACCTPVLHAQGWLYRSCVALAALLQLARGAAGRVKTAGRLALLAYHHGLVGRLRISGPWTVRRGTVRNLATGRHIALSLAQQLTLRRWTAVGKRDTK